MGTYVVCSVDACEWYTSVRRQRPLKCSHTNRNSQHRNYCISLIKCCTRPYALRAAHDSLFGYSNLCYTRHRSNCRIKQLRRLTTYIDSCSCLIYNNNNKQLFSWWNGLNFMIAHHFIEGFYSYLVLFVLLVLYRFMQFVQFCANCCPRMFNYGNGNLPVSAVQVLSSANINWKPINSQQTHAH